MKKCKPRYKQMAFETAVRNPERYKVILNSIKSFENKVLDDDVLLDIVCKLARDGIVTISSGDVTRLSDDVLRKEIIETNSTRRADGGFPSGYASRFWTYMRTPSELGFVYATYKEPLLFSEITHKLLNNEIDEQTAFANQSVIYNRRSPYRNVSNDFNYFRFIVDVLLERWKEKKGLSQEQFILSMFSKNGNVIDYLNEIKSFKCSDLNTTYNYLKNNYKITTKFGTVCKDYPDAVLRLLRLTGFVTLKYVGKLIIQINEDQIDYIKRIYSFKYSFNNAEKENRKDYFDKYCEYSLDLLSKTKNDIIDSSRIDYSSKLGQIVKNYNIDEKIIKNLINSVSTGKTIEAFKYIPDPIKLEFYIALLLYVKFGKIYVIKPNYKPDSLGLPISQAPGGKGDIEVYSKNLVWLVEVTLMRNKHQQLNNETSNLIRHLQETNKERYLTLVAPIIHDDTKIFFDNQILGFIKQKKIVYMKPITIDEFVDKTSKETILDEIKEYTYCSLKETIKELNNFNI